MSVHKLVIIVILVIGCNNSKKANNTERRFPLVSETETQLDKVIQKYADERKLAGASALLAQHGQIIYQKSFGWQNIESGRKMTNSSIYRIASMTKPVTTVALLQLMEQGKIDINEPASKYIPALDNAKVLEEDGSLQPINIPITVKFLLMHMAGVLPQNHELFRKADPYGKTSLEECVNAIAALPLYHQPGVSFTYGAQTNIVGRIVEVISGMTLDQYVTKNILVPLKMFDTNWVVPEKDTTRIASLYSPDGNLSLINGPMRQEMSYALGTRGLLSTSGDFYRFAQMLLNGGALDGVRILTEESVNLMTSNLLPDELYPLNAIGAPFPNTGFGLAVAVLTGDPKQWKPMEFSFPNHANLPGGSFHWPGVTGTYWWVDPANKVVGVLLTQTGNPAAHPVFQEFHQTFYTSTIYSEENLAVN